MGSTADNRETTIWPINRVERQCLTEIVRLKLLADLAHRLSKIERRAVQRAFLDVELGEFDDFVEHGEKVTA